MLMVFKITNSGRKFPNLIVHVVDAVAHVRKDAGVEQHGIGTPHSEVSVHSESVIGCAS